MAAIRNRICGMVGLRVAAGATVPYTANDMNFTVRVRWLPVFAVALGRANAVRAEQFEGDAAEELRLKGTLLALLHSVLTECQHLQIYARLLASTLLMRWHFAPSDHRYTS